MKRLAIRQALSLQASDNKISVVESFETEGRVKTTIELLAKLKLTGRIVLVVPEKTDLIDSHIVTSPASRSSVPPTLTSLRL